MFGGKNSTRTIDSLEVFDVHREIWRQFPSNFEKRCMMSATQLGQSKDIIHIMGGLDQYDNILSTVTEFNTKDMKSFESDWRLPKNLS